MHIFIIFHRSIVYMLPQIDVCKHKAPGCRKKWYILVAFFLAGKIHLESVGLSQQTVEAGYFLRKSLSTRGIKEPLPPDIL